MRDLRFRLEQGGLLALSALSRLLPKRAAPLMGGAIGTLFWACASRRRGIAAENVERALGEQVDPAGRSRIVRSACRQLGRTLVEGLLFSRYTARDIGRIIHYTGLEHIRAAYESGRGVLLFSGHFGNWELVALMQGYLRMPLTMVTRPLDNPLLEARLARLRGLSGNDVLHKRNSARAMLAALSAGRGVAIVIDQNVRDGSAVFVDFFGRKAATTPALALLALRTGASVIPVFALPRPDGSYLVEYLPEVVPERTGSREADVFALTQRCTAIIEGYVRRYPGAWLWMHERWKTRPRGESSAPARAREATA